MLFQPSSEDASVPQITPAEMLSSHTSLMRPSKTQAHQEILRILRESDPHTISIIAIGPLTNIALAAKEDPETFLRAKELIVMGGAISMEGNVSKLSSDL